jgi:hypothetical protein
MPEGWRQVFQLSGASAFRGSVLDQAKCQYRGSSGSSATKTGRLPKFTFIQLVIWKGKPMAIFEAITGEPEKFFHIDSHII